MTRSFLLSTLLSSACISVSPVTQNVPCEEDRLHAWRVPVRDGLLAVRVDTVDPMTAFDPDLFLYSVTKWSRNPTEIETDFLIEYEDDTFPCTFPPPDEYECPQFLTEVTGVEQDLLVLVGIVGSCASGEAGYILTVEHDGRPQRIRYVGKTYADLYTQ